MLFNSLSFAVFFPAVCLVYFALPSRHRTLLLLVASCGFYMAFIPAYILILALTILIDYAAGIYLERTTGPARRATLLASILATCLVLFVFKYFHFFTDSFVGLAQLAGWNPTAPAWQIILPIGLSFHTFQSLSYVIEVYRGHQRAEHDFITYATYVMFFPQLVAGPIERPQNLLHQFRETHNFDYARITSGLKRMGWGFFKKVVVADRLALFVNDVFSDPRHYHGFQLTLAVVFFAYQIYCDFSGYSDIAIGTARILGFRLMENFDSPYHSRSIAEFWRRWHISLSTWFRDYVYVPLGGSRVTVPRWYFNLLVTFAISGLWHGAAWNFVIWGLLNGLYLVCSVATQSWRTALARQLGWSNQSLVRQAAQIGFTFGLTCLAWVFFRAGSIGDAWYILTHFWRDWSFAQLATENFLLRQMPAAVAGIVILEFGEWCWRHPEAIRVLVPRPPLALRWTGYIAGVVAVTLFGVFRHSQFIYFQF